MTTTLTNFRRTNRGALLAILSATLLAACGGGDDGAEALDAAAATSLREPGAGRTVDFEAAPLHEARAPGGGWRRVPICLDAPPACPPNVPPMQ
jgi:hypothetical protein